MNPAGDPLVASVTSLPAEPVARPAVTLVQLPSTTTVRTERDALMAMLQAPVVVGRELLAEASMCGFSSAPLAAVRDSIGRNIDAFEQADWVTVVKADVPEEFRRLVEELAVAPIPERIERKPEAYLRRITIDLIQRNLLRRKEELIGRLQRTDAVAEPALYREIQTHLVQLEADRRAYQAE